VAVNGKGARAVNGKVTPKGARAPSIFKPPPPRPSSKNRQQISGKRQKIGKSAENVRKSAEN